MATDHVLVALDHSDCAHVVVDEAVQIAKGKGARLTLLHAIRLPSGIDEDTKIVPDRGEAPVEAGAYLRLINGTMTAMQAHATGVDAGDASLAGFTGGFVGGIAGGFLSLVNPAVGGGVGGALGNGLTTALLAGVCEQYSDANIARSAVIGCLFGMGGALVSNDLNFRTVAGGGGGGPVHAFAGEVLATGVGSASKQWRH